MSKKSRTPFAELRLGLFVHYVFFDAERVQHARFHCQRMDGTTPSSIDELADELDAQELAASAAAMRAEYVIFTAWHANMNLLYPSEAMNRSLPSHSSKRDVIRDLLNALAPHGIQLFLYVHPCDGHDFRPEDQERIGWNDGSPYTRWNNFINGVFDEVVRRYAGEVAGYWVDGGLPPQVNPTIGRLRETIRRADSNAVVIQNECFADMSFRRWADYGCREDIKFPYQAEPMQVAGVISGDWFADQSYLHVTPELAYQYTVLQAAVNGLEGGGVAWSAGPYAGGGWEPGVEDFHRRLGEYAFARAESIFGTRPSRAFITMPGTALLEQSTTPTYDDTLKQRSLAVATESQSGAKTYLHVLRPPASRTLHMPVPHNGKVFAKACYLGDASPVGLMQDDAGVHLTLREGAGWQPLDTVIVLQ